MKIDIITLFPEIFKGPLTESIISRAQKKGIVKIKTHQLRDWAINKHGQIDDRPYGGGAGMIMKIESAYNALTEVCGFRKTGSQKISNFQFPISNGGVAKPHIILLTPKGKKFNQEMARKLSKKEHLIFLCPHYEGYDHRIESLADEKISIGDYILTGGELPAAVIIDAVVRLVPGVINVESLKEETFGMNQESGIKNQELKFEYPQYTRPEIFEATIRGKKIKKRVPKVLLSGNHALIAKWRRENAK